MLGEAWGISATVNNAVSAFRPTRIVPFNPNAIPDYAFLTKQLNVANEQPENWQPNSSTDFPNTTNVAEEQSVTSGKAITDISFQPVLTPTTRKAPTNLTGVLTSPEYIKFRREKDSKKKTTKPNPQRKNAKNMHDFSSSNSDDPVLDDSSNGDANS